MTDCPVASVPLTALKFAEIILMPNSLTELLAFSKIRAVS
jgi:hypothetical protein